MKLLYFIGIFFAIVAICIFLYIVLMRKKHIERLNAYRNTFQRQFPEQESSLFDILLRRTKNYISNYIIFQAVGKSAESLSVMFSICSFALTGIMLKIDHINTIISLISMVFVIVTIYIIPNKRYREYLCAWRMCDAYILKVLASECELSEAIRQIEAIEETITTDEE